VHLNEVTAEQELPVVHGAMHLPRQSADFEQLHPSCPVGQTQSGFVDRPAMRQTPPFCSHVVWSAAELHAAKREATERSPQAAGCSAASQPSEETANARATTARRTREIAVSGAWCGSTRKGSLVVREVFMGVELGAMCAGAA
jgi:hypothetical protein